MSKIEAWKKEEMTDQPRQSAERTNSPDVCHAQMVEVGGDPALQDEEAKPDDAVDPTQRKNLACIVCCAR